MGRGLADAAAALRRLAIDAEPGTNHFTELEAAELRRAADEMEAARAELAAPRASAARLRAALEIAVAWCPMCRGRADLSPGCEACRPARDALAAAGEKGD